MFNRDPKIHYLQETENKYIGRLKVDTKRDIMQTVTIKRAERLY